MIWFAVAELLGAPSNSIDFVLPFAVAIAGVLLIAGLWTPVVATLTAIGEVWMAISLYGLRPGDAEIRVILAILSFSLAMLGPGAWSIDARLFGRKRFDIDRSKQPSP